MIKMEKEREARLEDNQARRMSDRSRGDEGEWNDQHTISSIKGSREIEQTKARNLLVGDCIRQMIMEQ